MQKSDNLNKRNRKGAAKKRSQSCNTNPKISQTNSQQHQSQQTRNGNINCNDILLIVHEETKEAMANMNPEEPVYDEDAEV